ncbi:hypothetical protein [Plantibacter flavus]|uniref:hypothetical protein n=1 Tax=Plantibacter flavus TaxID=150123 RepID=UPI0012947956|nr:hypothetical protein [Plantibacter flavus]
MDSRSPGQRRVDDLTEKICGWGFLAAAFVCFMTGMMEVGWFGMRDFGPVTVGAFYVALVCGAGWLTGVYNRDEAKRRGDHPPTD